MKREERKAQTRQALVDAAVVEFGRHGFRGARVEGIAGAAGVTTGALYTHFRSKEELYLAVYEALTARVADEFALLAGVTEGPDRPEGPTGPKGSAESDSPAGPGAGRVGEDRTASGPAPIDPAGRPRDLAGAADAWLAWHANDSRWVRLAAEFLLSAADLPAIRDDVVERRRRVRESMALLLVTVAEQRGRRLTVPPEELALQVHALFIGMALEQLGDPEAVIEGRFGRWVDTLVTIYTEEAP